MTNGSSQGLFVVVAVVIFGIFVTISYSLFRDTLTPSLASIFQESTTMPTTFYLPDTPKGKEYKGIFGTTNNEEFIKVDDFNMSFLGDNYTKDTLYEIKFFLKTSKEGKVRLYTQNNASTKYQMLFSQSNFTDILTFEPEKTNEFIEYNARFKLSLVNSGEHRGNSFLAFYSIYGTANKITVKDISVRKIGTLK